MSVGRQSVIRSRKQDGSRKFARRRWRIGFAVISVGVVSIHRSSRATLRARVALSFLELVEAKVVAACRAQGISAKRVRHAREFAAQRLDADYPFATRGFATDGSHLLYEFEQTTRDAPKGPLFVDIGSAAAQTTLPGYIQDVVELLEFANVGLDWPTCFYPQGIDEPLTVDPTFRGGQLTIKGRGIFVDSIWGRWKAGESVDFIARDFRISTADVQAAIDFREAA